MNNRPLLVLLLALVSSLSEGFVPAPVALRSCVTRALHLSSSSSSKTLPNEEEETQDDKLWKGLISARTVYMDIAIANQPIGRLVFDLAVDMEGKCPLPYHTENLIQLCTGSRRGVDPMAHYVGCEFDFSPASVEDGMGRYRWGHQFRGRGRNAIGRADQPIVDVENQRKHSHSCFGGSYYGAKYVADKDDPGVMLTVPVMGPGHGTSKCSIVRVGESPPEWGERLLLNAGVIGRMRPESLPVLHGMARQRMGPPTVVAAGVLEDNA